MEGNVVDSSTTNETIEQPVVVDQWKGEPNESSNNTASDNNGTIQNLSEKFDDTTISNNIETNNTNAEQQESNNDFTVNENSQNTWVDKSEQGNKNNSRNDHGRGRYNKSNHGNHSFERSSNYDSTSNNFGNNRGPRRGRGRGRGNYKRSNDENESFRDGNNSNYNNHEGRRGREHHRGRGGRFGEKLNDGWYGNHEGGHKKKDGDKFSGPKPEYIPPDIESEEFIAGIEAGLNFDKYDTIEVKVSGTDPPKRLTSFHDSGLRDILLDNLTAYNFCTPTPVQNYALPIVMAGRDLMASAQTGSGKTAAYVLPILNNLLSQSSELVFDENHCEPHVIIMAPTRELVVQIYECIWKFGKGTNIRNGLLYGGTSIGYQKSKLLQGGVHILTATPGRLNDFVEKGIVTFSSVKVFVLDEADRMLDMGFKPEIERILTHSTMTSNDLRQTIMFSATFASEIQQMATSFLKSDYIFVAVGEIGGACKDVVQTVMEVKKFSKKEALYNLLKDMENCQGTLVFVEQKRHADYYAAYLSEKDFPTTSIHGAREQPEREHALRDFKTNRMKILVATAVAARGLDIKGVNNVVNFDLPKTIDEYVHRIGRTGRLGNAGKAISFFDPDADGPLASELIRILQQAEQEVPQWLHDIAARVQAAPAIDDFTDIRTNVEVTSELVPTEEEPW